MTIPLTPAEQQFKANFVVALSETYAIRQPAGKYKKWSSKKKRLSDPVWQAHVRGDYWVATPAPYYPVYYNLDIDSPTSRTIETIFSQFGKYGITEHQYALMTTPSFSRSGNFRVYMRFEYKGKVPHWKMGYRALENAFGSTCELYPQWRRKDRLPCGRHQDIMLAGGRVLPELTWQQELNYLLRIEPIPIEQLPWQRQLFDEPIELTDDPQHWLPRGDAKDLLDHGLQKDGTRNHSQWLLLNDLWRDNRFPEPAIRIVKEWIRKKHNNFSKEVRKGNWHSIDGEIERQAACIWGRRIRQPDPIHNLQTGVTKDDLLWIAELFPGDAVRQKQLFNLAAYCRPRFHHDWIWIPAHIWRDDIACVRTYKGLIAELEEKKLLKVDHNYRIGEYSKKFQLKLPKTKATSLLQDERNAEQYYQSLRLAFPSLRDIADVTGLARNTLWRHFQQEGVTKYAP